VLEEKGSRVVEVLLARIPARALLAGKIAGIGLLGLAQIAVTALAAFIAVTAVGSIDIPAIRGTVLAWAVVWFVLGYALYATLYGALGSLGSRAEDAQAVAGPVMVFLPVAYLGAGARPRPEPGHHHRAGAACRAALHQRHPAQRAGAQPERRLA